MTMLEYSKWGNFKNVINKAKEACKGSDIAEEEHFADFGRVLKVGNNAEMEVDDLKLTRYACYLIAQNGDSRKKAIALAQTYFAVQTRKQEITRQEYEQLSEDEKRLYTRQNVKDKNKYLFDTAKLAGVKNYGKFNNYGYRGLYNGETADDIAKRKGLRYREDILDNMNEDELVANLFRINQTKQKLLKDNVLGEKEAKDVHYEVGKKVRKAIADIGGMMPEEMPTPKKSLKELERERKKLEIKEQKKLDEIK